MEIIIGIGRVVHIATQSNFAPKLNIKKVIFQPLVGRETLFLGRIND